MAGPCSLTSVKLADKSPGPHLRLCFGGSPNKARGWCTTGVGVPGHRAGGHGMEPWMGGTSMPIQAWPVPRDGESRRSTASLGQPAVPLKHCPHVPHGKPMTTQETQRTLQGKAFPPFHRRNKTEPAEVPVQMTAP